MGFVFLVDGLWDHEVTLALHSWHGHGMVFLDVFISDATAVRRLSSMES